MACAYLPARREFEEPLWVAGLLEIPIQKHKAHKERRTRNARKCFKLPSLMFDMQYGLELISAVAFLQH